MGGVPGEDIDRTQYKEAYTEANDNKLVAAVEGVVLERLPIAVLASGFGMRGHSATSVFSWIWLSSASYDDTVR